jgi:hypothetical protein
VAEKAKYFFKILKVKQRFHLLLVKHVVDLVVHLINLLVLGTMEQSAQEAKNPSEVILGLAIN